jgi:hypothetical protein
MQIRKEQELQSYFGKDLIVVTDAQDIRDDWILPAEQVISPDSNVTLTTKLALSFAHSCCGNELSLMWLILNQSLLWSNFTDIKEFFQSYRGDASDLLHCKR